MKKLLLIIVLCLFLASPALAWKLIWDGGSDAEGYRIYYNILDIPEEEIMYDVGLATECLIDELKLTKGTRYEFWCTAYNRSEESADSNHIRWTYPIDPVIIEMLGAPVIISIMP